MNPDILSIHSENANVKSKIRLFLWYGSCIPLRGSEDFGIFFAFQMDNQMYLVNNDIPFLERQVEMMHTHILLFTLEKNVECTIAIKLDMCTFTPF